MVRGMLATHARVCAHTYVQPRTHSARTATRASQRLRLVHVRAHAHTLNACGRACTGAKKRVRYVCVRACECVSGGVSFSRSHQGAEEGLILGTRQRWAGLGEALERLIFLHSPAQAGVEEASAPIPVDDCMHAPLGTAQKKSQDGARPLAQC